GGSGGSRYRLHVGAFPRPNAIYPPGGPAGETLSVRFIGDMTGDIERTVTLPAGPNPDYRLTVRHDGLDAPSPNRFRVSAFGNVLETEPNDEREAAGTSGEGELPTLPQAFNGIIERDGDVDWYRFRAKKGQKFQVRLHARSVRSPLDGVLSLHRADGNQLSHNDDSGGPDSGFGFNVPADDEYFFRVHDHLMKGGPGYVYRIETVPVEASLSVRVPNFGRDSQARKTISVPRGNRTATLVTTSRDNVGGDLVFEAPGLPEGVVLHGQTIPSNLRQMPIVFEAAPEAPLAGALVDFVVRLADPKRELRGGYHHTIDLVLGAPNRTVFYRTRTATLPVAVTEAAPFSIELVPPTVPLVQNGSMNLKVVAHRREGFDNPITVRMLWKPPGIGASNTVQIGKGQTECAYPINANGGAQNRTWHIAILGEADANGQVRVSSKLTPLTVEPPYVGLKIEMAAYEQGEKGEIVCKIEHRKAFEGPAAIELLGLPAKVSTTGGRKITRDDEQIVFDVDVAKDSPPGKHNNLFCRLIVQEREAPILHNLGRGGVLRIDKPPPPKKNAPPKPKVKPKPKPKPKKQPEKKPEKRLTRLEKLRLQAKQRAEAMQ
ncbi:MAG: peptidase, partial [Phycisphaeraceae bacterium]|nr:peptidase [Phycisphaeraceae bacterium]